MIRVALFAVSGTALALAAVAIEPAQLAEWIPGIAVAGLIIGLMLGLAMADVIAKGDARLRAEQAHAEIVELAERDPWELAEIIAAAYAGQLVATPARPDAFGAADVLGKSLTVAVAEHRMRIYAEEHELVGDERIER